MSQQQREKLWRQTVVQQHFTTAEVRERQRARQRWEQQRRRQLENTLTNSIQAVNEVESGYRGAKKPSDVGDVSELDSPAELETNEILINQRPINITSNAIHVRGRRQVGEILIPSLVVGTAGFFMGKYANKEQIKKISDTVEDATERQRHIVSYLNSSNNELQYSRAALSHLQKTEAAIAVSLKAQVTNEKLRSMYLFVKANLNDLEHLLLKWRNVLQQGIQGSLALESITVKGLEKALMELVVLAKKQGFKMVTPHIDQIFGGGKVSILKTNFGVRAFIFFPIYRESDKFKLFKFIPVPLKLSNKTLIEIDPTNNMLAVKFSQNDFVFKEMKEKDLKDCEVMKEQYVCQENIYFKKSHASCLKSMYFQTRYKELLDDCKVFAKTAKRRVIKVAQNTFIFAFPETAY